MPRDARSPHRVWTPARPKLVRPKLTCRPGTAHLGAVPLPGQPCFTHETEPGLQGRRAALLQAVPRDGATEDVYLARRMVTCLLHPPHVT